MNITRGNHTYTCDISESGKTTFDIGLGSTKDDVKVYGGNQWKI